MTELPTVTHNWKLQEIDQACRLVAEASDGAHGQWSYEAFDYLNATYWDAALPTPLILWDITKYGHCLGQTRPRQPARIWLHPALLGGSTTETPWGIEPRCLGLRFALDVLVHEMMHLAVHSLYGGGTGPTSHNCPEWIAETNRLAAMMGFEGVTAGQSKVKRVPVEGPLGPRGKPPTRVMRVSEGSIDFDVVSRFPHGYRVMLGQTDYYRGTELPFPHALEGSRYIQLGVTDAEG